MAKARRLTGEERLRIARERSEGMSAAELAERHRVSLKSVYNAISHAQGRQISNGSRPQVVGLRLSPAELRGFDAALSARGVVNRTDALRALIGAARDLLAPDEHMTAELRSFGAALNRVGNNVNQIARRLNEGRGRGALATLTPAETAAIRALSGLIYDMADQVQEMSRNRRAVLQLEVDEALAPLVAEAHHGAG